MKRLICMLLATILCLTHIPVSAVAVTGTEPISTTTGWYWPLPASNQKITSGFGASRGSNSLHQGVDISASTGTNIFAARAGVVYLAGWHKSMGNYVCIRHGMGNGKYVYTTYMHMTKRAVAKGAEVNQNTVIGYVGSTGDSSGPHLHFHIFTSSSKSPYSVSPSHKNKNDLKNYYINPSSVQYSYTRSGSSQNVIDSAGQATASTLKISMTSYPENLRKGSSYGLRGTVSSNYNIKSVSGSVTNSSGNTVLSSYDAPNAKSMNVKNSALNGRLAFNKLATGTYTMKVVATDTSGKTVSWSTSFRIYTSNLSINMTRSPTSIKYRNSFGLRGNVNSNEKITLVSGSVINSSGITVLSSTDRPNTTSMDVRTANLNDKLAFNQLSRGSYTLKVVATDASGNSVTWSISFRVY